jgi:isochorismate synthase
MEIKINNQTPFAIYSLPGSDQIYLIAQSGPEHHSVQKEDALHNMTGFVFLPFSQSETGYLIKGHSKEIDKDHKVFKNISNHTDNNSRPIIINKSQYLKTCNQAISTIQNGEIKKVILSRVIPAGLPENFSTGSFFLSLLDENPGQFTYWIYHPVAGNWVGSTPEILAGYQKGMLKTMALAGTQQAQPAENQYEWKEKETEEQGFVKQFMEDVFNKLGIIIHQFKTRTIVSGNVAHICTTFQGKTIPENATRFIWHTHPTPAVCGLPVDKAYHWILKNEKHQRKFYTGFLGPVQQGDIQLYVNLRCGQIIGNEIFVYAGGGITQDSVAESEWQETEWKSQSLLKILNQNN